MIAIVAALLAAVLFGAGAALEQRQHRRQKRGRGVGLVIRQREECFGRRGKSFDFETRLAFGLQLAVELLKDLEGTGACLRRHHFAVEVRGALYAVVAFALDE